MDTRSKIKAFVLGIIALLGGLFLLERSKRKSAEAVLSNLDTKEKLNDLDKDIKTNEGILASEEDKRKEIEKEAEKEKNDAKTIEELEKFFNRPNDSN